MQKLAKTAPPKAGRTGAQGHLAFLPSSNPHSPRDTRQSCLSSPLLMAPLRNGSLVCPTLAHFIGDWWGEGWRVGLSPQRDTLKVRHQCGRASGLSPNHATPHGRGSPSFPPCSSLFAPRND